MTHVPSTTDRLGATLADAAFMLAAFLVLALALFTPGEGGVNVMGLVYGIGIVAVTAAGLSLALRDGPVLVRAGLAPGGLVYIGAIVVSVILAAARRDALLRSFRDLLVLVPAAVLIVTMPRDAARRRSAGRLLLWGMLGALALTLLYGAYQYFIFYPEVLRQIEEDPEAVKIAFEIGDPRMFKEFLVRVRSREIYSTFLLSNSFAGYLVVWCPVLLGLAVDGRRLRRTATADGKTRSTATTLCAAAMALLALSIFNISLTDSKGAWAALPVGLFAMWAVGHGGWMRRRWPMVALAAAALSVVAILVSFTDLLGVGPITSMVYRLGYWRGTLEVIGHSIKHAVIGVGPDNFKAWYTQLKPAASQEVGTPHNDYLGILATLGVVGLLGFLGAWFGFVRQARRMAAACGGEGGQASHAALRQALPRRRFVALCIVVGLVTLFVPITTGLFAAEAAVRTRFWFAALPVVGIGMLVFALRMERHAAALETTWTRRGIFGGLTAFAAHILVDFDWEVPGIAATVTVLAVLYVVLEHRQCAMSVWRPRRGVALGLGAAMAVLALAGYALVVSPAIASRHAAETAAMHRQSWLLMRRDPAAGDDPAALGRRLWEEVRVDLVRRARTDPGEPELWRELAALYELFWRETGRDAMRRDAIGALEREATLRPVHYQPHHRQALIYAMAAREEPDPARRKLFLASALDAYRESIARYPTLPALHLEYARILRRAGKEEAAREAYRRALELDEQITQTIRHLTEQERKEAGLWR